MTWAASEAVRPAGRPPITPGRYPVPQSGLSASEDAASRTVSQSPPPLVTAWAVSEPVTKARTYAPGPCLLDLAIGEGAVRVSVWDCSHHPAVGGGDGTRTASVGTAWRS